MYDKVKAEATLKFLNTAKWNHGVKDSVALVTTYKWLMEFFEEQENPKPKKVTTPKKAISNGSK